MNGASVRAALVQGVALDRQLTDDTDNATGGAGAGDPGVDRSRYGVTVNSGARSR